MNTTKDLYIRTAIVHKVVDADTVDLVVDLGFDLNILMRCRLYGINAWELKTDSGKVAKEFLAKLLPLGSKVTVQTTRDKKEKYGRYLATIFLLESGTNVNDLLVEMGHAVPYMV